MIRVILDTNIWISLFLKRIEHGSIVRSVAAAFRDDVELIVPQELIEELYTSIAKSSYLANRILSAEVDTLIQRFHSDAIVPPLIQHYKQFTRDPKDDYLIVYALMYAVDYLVTGDLDLLALHQVGHLQIVTPSQFLERLQLT